MGILIRRNAYTDYILKNMTNLNLTKNDSMPFCIVNIHVDRY